MQINQATIGTDPEALLFNRKTNEFCSAIDLIPEGKDGSNPPRDLGDGYKVLHDNVLLEFNVPPANGDGSEHFAHVLKEGFRRIYNVIGKNYDIAPIASHNFDKKYLKHPEAQRFGCSPEFCAYAVEVCQPPECAGTFRSAGAHIHIGRKDFKDFVEIDDFGNAYPKEDVKEGEVLIDAYSKLNIIKLMDIYIGLPLTLIDTSNASKDRKKLYGISGRHRPTAFGVEYRTPSNYWVSSPALSSLIYDLTLLALQQEIDGNADKVTKKFNEGVLRATLDKGDSKKARELIRKINLPQNILTTLNSFSNNLASPYDLRKNWGLNGKS